MSCRGRSSGGISAFLRVAVADAGTPRAGIRYQLEAKLLGPGGIALSVASCTVKQYFDDNGKIYCERTAFKVLARRVKRMFPRLSICAVGDALYACQPVMRICEDYGWKYVLTFKNGRTPAAYAESEALMRLCSAITGGAAATSTSSCSWRTTSGRCSRRGAFQGLTRTHGAWRSTTGLTSWPRCSSSSA